jgi:hypothetical protein
MTELGLSIILAFSGLGYWAIHSPVVTISFGYSCGVIIRCRTEDAGSNDINLKELQESGRLLSLTSANNRQSCLCGINKTRHTSIQTTTSPFMSFTLRWSFT